MCEPAEEGGTVMVAVVVVVAVAAVVVAVEFVASHMLLMAVFVAGAGLCVVVPALLFRKFARQMSGYNRSHNRLPVRQATGPVTVNHYHRHEHYHAGSQTDVYAPQYHYHDHRGTPDELPAEYPGAIPAEVTAPAALHSPGVAEVFQMRIRGELPAEGETTPAKVRGRRGWKP